MEKARKSCGFRWRARDSFPEELVYGLRIGEETRQEMQGRVCVAEGTTCTKVASRKGQLYLNGPAAMCGECSKQGRMVQNEPGGQPTEALVGQVY